MPVEKHDRVVVDVDGVLVEKDDEKSYEDREPVQEVLDQLREYDRRGYYIILYTARNMNTYDGRLGKINANTAKVLLDWLEKYDVPHDEIHYGKPWCGHDGFYVDDKAIRPDEFVELSDEEIQELVGNTDEA